MQPLQPDAARQGRLLTRPQTPWENVTVLLTRGLTAPEVAKGLDLPEHRVREVARDVRDDGSRDLYLDSICALAKADPHPEEAKIYLYVRGVFWEDCARVLGLPRRSLPKTASEAKAAFRHKQLRLARAGCLPS